MFVVMTSLPVFIEVDDAEVIHVSIDMAEAANDWEDNAIVNSENYHVVEWDSHLAANITEVVQQFVNTYPRLAAYHKDQS